MHKNSGKYTITFVQENKTTLKERARECERERNEAGRKWNRKQIKQKKKKKGNNKRNKFFL